MKLEKSVVRARRLLPILLGLSLLAAPLQGHAADKPLVQDGVLYHAGTNPYDAVADDVNGDGRADVIVFDLVENKISVLLGNGDGTFQMKQDTSVGRSPRAVTVADFNGDGHADVAVSNAVDNTVGILIGRGDGTFEQQVAYPTGNWPVGLAAKDFNGDGILDLAVTNNSSNTVSILRGMGDGTFRTAITVPVGMSPRSVASEDLNSDGIVDLAVANVGSNNVNILLGDGQGGFTSVLAISSGRSPIGLQAADLNSDGYMDLALAANGDHTANVFLGNGDGTFRPVATLPLGHSPLDLEVADFDGDGNLDLLGGVQDSSNPILLGNGEGTFQSARTYFDRPSSAVASGDFNGDGKADIIDISYGYIKIFNSAAEGVVSLAQDRYEAAENSASVTVSVYRAAGSYGQTKVSLRTIEGTAIAGTDYNSVDELLVFNEGETTKSYPISIIDRDGDQGDRTFFVELVNPTNGAVLGASARAEVTIREPVAVPDTTPPVIDVSKFRVIDQYQGTPDQLYGEAGAVSEAGAMVKAYPWVDADADGTVNAGEWGAPIGMGLSAADGSILPADIGDLGPGTYAFVVTAADAAGNESAQEASAVVTMTLVKDVPPNSPDTSPPSWQTGAKLIFSRVTSSAVTLEWPAASDDRGIAAYEIYQDGTIIQSVPATIRNYTINGLAANTTYNFAIKAVDAARNVSPGLEGTIQSASAPGSGSGSGSGSSSSGSVPSVLSSESRLQQLSLTAGDQPITLTPPFQAGVYDYTVTTKEAQVVVSPRIMHSAAKVEINGERVTSGYTVPLKDGDNVLTIRVQAEDGSATTYRLTLKREPLEETGDQPDQEIQNSFIDIQGHWAEPDIQKAFTLGIVKGDVSGTFRPHASVSRAEWAVMMGRLLKADLTGSSISFTDGNSIPAWAHDGVHMAVTEGLMIGYADGTFRPGQPITRAEIAAVLGRVMNESSEMDGNTSYADDSGIPVWAKPYVQAAADYGLLQGRGASRFAPNEPMTRAEAAVLLVRLSRVLGS
ncbi:hypothetical protein GCM10008915_51720 [Bifidobacterium pullorum subsp. gallinarum]